MRVLIVEDERVAARGLERMVKAIVGNSLQSLNIQSSLTASEFYIMDHPIDLLLLDLNLGGEDGFALLKMAAAGSFQTIVVSANTDRAVNAFEYGVLDFVAKPPSEERLRKAIDRMDRSTEAAGQPARYLSVPSNDTVQLISLTEVLFFQGQDNYVAIHLTNGETKRHRKTLDSLEKILPARFERVHKSFIVDLDRVDHIERHPGSKYELILPDEIVLPLSRGKYRELKSRFS